VLRVKIAVSVFTAIVLATLLPGCYQIPVNQGNRIEPTALERLKVGMTREQVRYLMGTPILQDPFDQSRWSYVSRYKVKGVYKEEMVILHFKGDVLTQIVGELEQAPPLEKTDEENEETPVF
jgi:outer membrane protein assembly factor BamE